MLLHPKLMKTPKALGVGVFFDELLPRTLSERAEAARALGGTCRLVVSGEDGGTWRVDLGKPEVCRDDTRSAICEIRLSQEDLLCILTGSGDPEGSVELEGDPAPLRSLALLLKA